MVAVFVDTSALFALLDAEGTDHARAADAFRDLAQDVIVTHRYVIAESAALVRQRLGPSSVAALVEGLLAPMTVLALSDELFDSVLAAHGEATGASGLSLVDRLSFALMRHEGITTAFAFDRDFVTAGFAVVPASREGVSRA